MSANYYEEAHKQAAKEYRRCVSKGIYPYLPVLDHMLPQAQLNKGCDAGMINVPAELIVGTKTEGRARSFSGGFMPLLKSGTEFAVKWCNLCTAHQKEGIRDAVKLYEYMNRYYVEEGNKRVSVLKFFGAVTIPAVVIRVLPENRGEESVELYYELVDFEKVTGLYYIEFSKRGRYEELLGLLGKTKYDKWTDEDRSSFSSAYYYFSKVYKASVGRRFEITPADAMLAYIKVFGYEKLKETGEAELKKNLYKMAEEILLMKEAEPIQLDLMPTENKSSFLTQMKNMTTPSLKKIAFIHEKNTDNSGWAYNHELGKLYLEEKLGDKIKVTSYYNASQEVAGQVINKAIEEGNQVIFTTAPRLYQASLQAAVENPKIAFLNCSLNKSHRYVRSYYGRIYEAKFIAGAIAATMSESGRLGYICTYPIYGQIAGINAFALGAQMINPKARVYLEWSSVEDLQKTVNKLVSQRIHYISSVETMPRHDKNHKYFGLLKAGGEDLVSLAVPVWNWGTYYEDIIRQILEGTYQQMEEASNKALNYYWGMSAGVVDILCSANMPYASKKLADILQESIRSGLTNPFTGPIVSQEGKEIIPAGMSLSMEDIISMDYLVDNVVGSMPAYKNLSPGVQATADVMGIDRIGR